MAPDESSTVPNLPSNTNVLAVRMLTAPCLPAGMATWSSPTRQALGEAQSQPAETPAAAPPVGTVADFAPTHQLAPAVLLIEESNPSLTVCARAVESTLNTSSAAPRKRNRSIMSRYDGAAIAARIATMATTTISSINVNPCWDEEV